ncbi:uncharacterized protein LOC119264812 [Pygocentrus nattereri]|uniref:uncharacterized protein LOC119264812 n=1 Tax=Pygocentrus nattereri TaxID=42514 RepID=UPI0018915FC1|nr:uncharacterized protein LOC119264812 [Pygocentrus nattereri]
MIPFYMTVSTALGGTSQIDIACLDGLKVLQDRDNISLTCSFSYFDASVIAWFKQTPGEKPLLIASAFGSAPEYHNDFDKSGRFNTLREQSSFTLSISNATTSDSATYYCSIAYYTDIALLGCTVLVLEGSSSSLSAVLQPPVSDPVELGGDTTLQCSILTDASAGDHSVYWFRHGSGESHPGIIYTHGNRSGECKKSSETDSPTQSCVYKLPKRNLSLSDAGTYYCAVLMCGEIIFGNGTKLDFVENNVLDPAILVLAASNIITIIMVLFLCRKLYIRHHKDAATQVNQAEETGVLNYAALSFAQSSSSRRSRIMSSSDQPVYAQVKTHQ